MNCSLFFEFNNQVRNVLHLHDLLFKQVFTALYMGLSAQQISKPRIYTDFGYKKLKRSDRIRTSYYLQGRVDFTFFFFLNVNFIAVYKNCNPNYP